jgi:hypothetical protein
MTPPYVPPVITHTHTQTHTHKQLKFFSISFLEYHALLATLYTLKTYFVYPSKSALYHALLSTLLIYPSNLFCIPLKICFTSRIAVVLDTLKTYFYTLKICFVSRIAVVLIHKPYFYTLKNLLCITHCCRPYIPLKPTLYTLKNLLYITHCCHPYIPLNPTFIPLKSALYHALLSSLYNLKPYFYTLKTCFVSRIAVVLIYP